MTSKRKKKKPWIIFEEESFMKQSILFLLKVEGKCWFNGNEFKDAVQKHKITQNFGLRHPALTCKERFGVWGLSLRLEV